MKKRMSGTVAFTRLVTLAAVLLAHHGLGQNYPAGHPQSLPLDGTWEYRLDPKNRGLDEKWYAHSFESGASLQFPGTLDDAGIGTPPEQSADSMTRDIMLHLQRRHQYVGVAWYRREVIIPENWKGMHGRLFLERVLWKSSLWIDGKPAGSRESLNTPHQYELDNMLNPGKHVLVLRIDNSKQYDMTHRDMAHAYTNETQIMWNGVVGAMYLQAIPDASIELLQVFPQVKKHTARTVLKLENRDSRPVKARLQLRVFKGGELVKHQDTKLDLLPGQSRHVVQVPLGANVALWDEFNPNVYTLKAVLSVVGQDEARSEAQVDFGLRELRTEKEQLFLNNRRVFLRGTLECSIFPLTGHPPTGKEGWLNVFLAARSYGLNHLRFHSWCPPEAAFEVADSLGFYLQAELPLWVTNFGEDTATVRFIREEAERMIAAYGNHPSFCFFSLGNELQGDFDLLKSILLELKERDPRHLYTTTTFTFQKGHGDWPEPQDDFFVTQWTHKGWVRGQGIFNNRYPDFQTDYSAAIDSTPVPIITHEIGQYSVYPRLDEIEKYTGVLEPLNFMAVRNDLKRKELLDYANDFTLASGKLAVLLYKEEIERALKTRDLSGFQLLDLHDFPGQGTALVGILDAFWDSKGLIDPADFRNFCSPVVPLLRFPKAVYTADEYFEANAELSNYSDEVLKGVQAKWKISKEGTIGPLADEKSVIASGTFTATTAHSGSLTSLGSIRTSLSGVKKAAKLNVSITIPGTDYQNEWPIWVYPNIPDAGIENPEPDDSRSVRFTRSAEEALKLLAEGRRVLLNPDTADLQGVAGRFTQVFWSPVHFPNQPGTMGLLCDPEHPAFTDFPTDFHTNWQWWDLVMRSKSMVIDSLPPLEPVVRVIDNFFKNRKMALVVEASVGPGKLIICSADIATDLENRPVARQLRYSLLQYMRGTTFRPETELEEDDIRRLTRDGVNIQLGNTRQTIHSFGASDCWTAKFIGDWADVEKKNRIADLLFSMDTLANGNPKGIGLSLWRFNIGAGSFEQGEASGIRTDWRREECFQNTDGSWDWGKQQGQQWFLEAARKRGVRYTLGFSISPPVHMTRNGKAFSPGGKVLNIQPEKMDDFAVFLARVSDHFNFDYLSPVNEPQWDWKASGRGATQEGSPAQNREISQLVKLLSKELSLSGSEVQVVVGEAGEWDYLYGNNKDGRGNQVEAFFSPDSPNYIGGLPNVLHVISGHSYWTTCPDAKLTVVRQRVAGQVASMKQFSPSFPLNVWQTEFGILGDICGRYSGSPRNTEMDYGLYVARVIHHDLTVAEVSSWQWWLAVNPYDYSDGLVYINDSEGNIRPGNVKEDGIVMESKQLWVLGNFSRFIRPGMQRVEAIADSTPGADSLLISAWQDEANNKLVMVIVNESGEERGLCLPATSHQAPVEVFTTDVRRNLEKSVLTERRLMVPPRSVTTVVTQSRLEL